VPAPADVWSLGTALGPDGEGGLLYPTKSFSAEMFARIGGHGIFGRKRIRGSRNLTEDSGELAIAGGRVVASWTQYSTDPEDADDCCVQAAIATWQLGHAA